MTENFIPYKYIDIGIFCSEEWMGDQRRKYRTVFERNEINYLRFDLSFYNKLFDEKDWEAEISLAVYTDDKEKKEFFKGNKKVQISQDDNIVYHYAGWGVKDFGGYWKAGDYNVFAFINSELIGQKSFHIYDFGLVNQTVNPYFDVVNMRLFESIDGNPKTAKYLKGFKWNETRYVGIELEIKNKIKQDWFLEYYASYYDDAGQIKARFDNNELIKASNSTVKIHTAWGNDSGNLWIDDQYMINIVFMDVLVASTSFKMGNEEVKGDVELNKHFFSTPIARTIERSRQENTTVEQALQKLNDLIGLFEIKKKIQDYIKYLEFLKLRAGKGLKNKDIENLHTVFTGNPGTGKTTVARMLGEIYHRMGLLSKGHIVEVGRAELIGEFIGKTAPKTKKIIEEARGGVLFIDEAYSLVGKGDDDYGKEVIEVIIKEMSDGKGDIMIVAAGYPDEMDEFINANPGLKSRFKYFFHFQDYSPDELMQIAQYSVNKHSLEIDENAKKQLKKILVKAFRQRNKNFGNARYVQSLIDEAKMNMGLRIIENPNYLQLSEREISTIAEADIIKLEAYSTNEKKLNFLVDDDLLNSALDELNLLIGMDNIKREIRENIKLVRYYQEMGKNVLNTFSMHSIFTGNPGTGKTTIARLMAKIYKALGLLEKGHLVEIGRDGLVAGYVGQTAIKTKEALDSAMGGVLFIDEAYSLTGNSQNDYGSEAIEVILKFMEDNRGKFAVIAAGYPNNMNIFLKANPGLMSRFDKILHFDDYKPEQLMNIADIIARGSTLNFDISSRSFLYQHLIKLHQNKDKYFGNARTVRQIVEDVVKRQHLRMADINKMFRTPEKVNTITIEDVQHLNIAKEKPKYAPIGFRS